MVLVVDGFKRCEMKGRVGSFGLDVYKISFILIIYRPTLVFYRYSGKSKVAPFNLDHSISVPNTIVRVFSITLNADI